MDSLSAEEGLKNNLNSNIKSKRMKRTRNIKMINERGGKKEPPLGGRGGACP